MYSTHNLLRQQNDEESDKVVLIFSTREDERQGEDLEEWDEENDEDQNKDESDYNSVSDGSHEFRLFDRNGNAYNNHTSKENNNHVRHPHDDNFNDAKQQYHHHHHHGIKSGKDNGLRDVEHTAGGKQIVRLNEILQSDRMDRVSGESHSTQFTALSFNESDFSDYSQLNKSGHHHQTANKANSPTVLRSNSDSKLVTEPVVIRTSYDDHDLEKVKTTRTSPKQELIDAKYNNQKQLPTLNTLPSHLSQLSPHQSNSPASRVSTPGSDKPFSKKSSAKILPFFDPHNNLSDATQQDFNSSQNQLTITQNTNTEHPTHSSISRNELQNLQSVSIFNQQTNPTEHYTNEHKMDFCRSINTESYLNAIKIVPGDISNPSSTRKDPPKILCASANSTINVYSLLDGTPFPSLQGHTDRVISLAISAPFYTFNTTAGHHSQSGHVRKEKVLKTLVVSGSRDEMLKIWDLETSKCLHSIHAHKSPIWAVGITVRKDGSVIVISTSGDGGIRSWNGITGAKIRSFKGNTDKVLSIFILNPHSDLPFLITAGADKKVRVWDLLSGIHLRMFEGHEDEVNSVVSGSFTGMSSLVPISVGSVNFNDNAAGNIENSHSLETVNEDYGLSFKKLQSSKNFPLSSTFDPGDSEADGNQPKTSIIIVSGSRDHTVRVWDFHTGFLLFELLGHTACVYSVVLTKLNVVPTGTSLKVGLPIVVSCSDDSTIRFWSLETGKQFKIRRWHKVSVRAIDIARPFADSGNGVDGIQRKRTMTNQTVIVSCGWDKTVKLNDLDHALTESDGCCLIL